MIRPLFLLAALVAFAADASAVGGLTLLVGERGADYHRFTGGKGYQAAGGTDLTASLFTDPVKDFPVRFGLFYSMQRYAPDGAKALFDKATVTELGPQLEVEAKTSKALLFARYAQTLSGSFRGDIGQDRVLATGAGETAYARGSAWSAGLSGPHFGVGATLGNEVFQGGLLLDTAFLRSKVKSVTVGGQNVTKAYAPYMKTDSDFQSTALMVAVQVRK